MRTAKIILTAAVLFCLTACARNPVTGGYSLNFYSEAEEIQMGEEYHPEIVKEYGEYKDAALRDYVQGIVSRLGDASHRPNLDYRVTLLDTPEVNAFAIPGGNVYVCRGLLAYINSEAELAGVMGHEIGHVNAKHGVQQMSKSTGFDLGVVIGSVLLFGNDEGKQQTATQVGGIAAQLAMLSYSREDEMESDRLGIEYSYEAGFSPLGLSRIMVMFERLSGASSSAATALSTHPASETRSKQARIEIRKLEDRADFNHELDRERYLDKIAGLVTGAKNSKTITRLQIYTVQSGDSWSSLAKKYFNSTEPQRLAWFNDCELTDALPRRIKLGLF